MSKTALDLSYPLLNMLFGELKWETRILIIF